jgi:succinate dehydrogenase / fumarate reductase iron-sulfur subunit
MRPAAPAPESGTIALTLRVWRQEAPDAAGGFVEYPLPPLPPALSLLEALDALNESLVAAGQRPVAFESDCREGICGACGMMVNGFAHGGRPRTTTCELRLRDFPDGATVTLEPFRSAAFPLIRDLMVDRSALDRIVQAGGYISVRAGSAPEANAVPVPKPAAEGALDAAACIGCGACVAACPNGSAALFAGAKLTHLGLLPQGQPERGRRARALVAAMDRVGFGGCSFHGECHAACPKGIDLTVIARMNRDFLRAPAVSDERRRRGQSSTGGSEI